jgi:hypothetical protein
VREILFAGVEPDERPSLAGDGVSERASQWWVGDLEVVEHGSDGGQAVELDLDLGPYAGQIAQVLGEHDPDHERV